MSCAIIVSTRSFTTQRAASSRRTSPSARTPRLCLATTPVRERLTLHRSPLGMLGYHAYGGALMDAYQDLLGDHEEKRYYTSSCGR